MKNKPSLLKVYTKGGLFEERIIPQIKYIKLDGKIIYSVVEEKLSEVRELLGGTYQDGINAEKNTVRQAINNNYGGNKVVDDCLDGLKHELGLDRTENDGDKEC